MSTPTLAVSCNIELWDKEARRKIQFLCDSFHADAVDPLEYKCSRCNCAWDSDILGGMEAVTCSNCYSGQVLLTKARLAFYNWGEQNGGELEQMDRYRIALKAVELQR